jgi:hypothetical protein
VILSDWYVWYLLHFALGGVMNYLLDTNFVALLRNRSTSSAGFRHLLDFDDDARIAGQMFDTPRRRHIRLAHT